MKNKLEQYLKTSQALGASKSLSNKASKVIGYSLLAGSLPILTPVMSFAQGACETAGAVTPTGGQNSAPLIGVGGASFSFDAYNINPGGVIDAFLKVPTGFSIAYMGSGDYPFAAQIGTTTDIDSNLNWTPGGLYLGNRFVEILDITTATVAGNWDEGDSGFIGIRKEISPGVYSYGFIALSIGNPISTNANAMAVDPTSSGLADPGQNGAITPGQCGDLALAPTPVELLRFTAENVSTSISLEWSTVNELNNAGFEIQRSTDGQRFVALDFVEGNGTTSDQQSYTFVDDGIIAGQLYYYRLKQIDYNGDYEFSPIATAELVGTGSKVIGDFFPNPSDGLSKLNYTSSLNETLTVKVFDITGQQMLQINKSIQAGSNLLDFDFSMLAKGSYFVKIEGQAQNLYQKLVIN